MVSAPQVGMSEMILSKPEQLNNGINENKAPILTTVLKCFRKGLLLKMDGKLSLAICFLHSFIFLWTLRINNLKIIKSRLK